MSRGRTTVDRVGFLSFLETLVQVMGDVCVCVWVFRLVILNKQFSIVTAMNE